MLKERFKAAEYVPNALNTAVEKTHSKHKIPRGTKRGLGVFILFLGCAAAAFFGGEARAERALQVGAVEVAEVAVLEAMKKVGAQHETIPGVQHSKFGSKERADAAVSPASPASIVSSTTNSEAVEWEVEVEGTGRYSASDLQKIAEVHDRFSYDTLVTTILASPTIALPPLHRREVRSPCGSAPTGHSTTPSGIGTHNSFYKNVRR